MKKRKAVKQLKKMRKAGVRAWKKKKKKGKMLAFFLFLTPFLFSTSANRAGELAGAFCAMAGKREDPGIPDPKRSSPGTICIGKSGKNRMMIQQIRF